jgi:hypothetical protein
VILGHHGGEAPLLQAAVAAVGSLSVALGLFRVELYRLGRRFRRRPGSRTNETRADGAATNEGGKE